MNLTAANINSSTISHTADPTIAKNYWIKETGELEKKTVGARFWRWLTVPSGTTDKVLNKLQKEVLQEFSSIKADPNSHTMKQLQQLQNKSTILVQFMESRALLKKQPVNDTNITSLQENIAANQKLLSKKPEEFKAELKTFVEDWNQHSDFKISDEQGSETPFKIEVNQNQLTLISSLKGSRKTTIDLSDKTEIKQSLEKFFSGEVKSYNDDQLKNLSSLKIQGIFFTRERALTGAKYNRLLFLKENTNGSVDIFYIPTAGNQVQISSEKIDIKKENLAKILEKVAQEIRQGSDIAMAKNTEVIKQVQNNTLPKLDNVEVKIEFSPVEPKEIPIGTIVVSGPFVIPGKGDHITYLSYVKSDNSNSQKKNVFVRVEVDIEFESLMIALNTEAKEVHKTLYNSAHQIDKDKILQSRLVNAPVPTSSLKLSSTQIYQQLSQFARSDFQEDPQKGAMIQEVLDKYHGVLSKNQEYSGIPPRQPHSFFLAF